MKEIITTAVWNGEYFEDFCISERSASVYGHKPEDIVKVKVTEVENQIRPSTPSNRKVREYWAWWCTRDGNPDHSKFDLIYHAYLLLEMCFPYGIEAEEVRNKGKAYRVRVERA